jgi:hypothetical protein
MVDVTDGANVDVRFAALELHFHDDISFKESTLIVAGGRTATCHTEMRQGC